MGSGQDQEHWLPVLERPSFWEGGVWTGRCSVAAADDIWHGGS